MRATKMLPIAALGLALAGCQSIQPLPNVPIGSATLHFADGKPAGTARLYGNGTEVTISVALSGFMPGNHAVHLHTIGRCDAPGFTSAGGHLNPFGKQHGRNNPNGSHLGDLPNAMIGPNGSGTVSATLAGPQAEVLDDIFDKDGTAVIVHAGPDDNTSDPAGAAGPRIACGVVKAASN